MSSSRLLSGARAARSRRRVAPCALLTVLSLASCARPPVLSFELDASALTVRKPAIYPETIAYDPHSDTFLLGSFREGAVYRVAADGSAERLIDDARLCSVLGIALDVPRGRLWLVSSDLGASTKPCVAGPKRAALVAVYDLATGAPLQYVDIATLAVGPHLLNGIALDADGNAYVSDSFSPNLYKVDAQGRASLFLQSERFAGEGINLNGMVVHPDGYLLLVKKSDGALFKVPLGDPARFSEVRLEKPLVAADGLTLIGKRDLLVIANQTPQQSANAAYALLSDDGWSSAKLRGTQKLGDSYPTTAVQKGDQVYVLASQLNELIKADAALKAGLRAQATIRVIAKVAP
jgi:sugar lactone lactonase YvrE